MKNVIYDILIGLISSFVFLLIGKMIAYFLKFVGSAYSGKWRAEIRTIENDSEIIKVDEWIIKHNKRKNTLSGTIRRILPDEQSYRKWFFRGVIQSNSLLLVYWASDGVPSYGCVNCVLVNDFTFAGFYLEAHNGAIEKIPIRIEKQKRELKFRQA